MKRLPGSTMNATPLNQDDRMPIALNLVGEPTTIVLNGKKRFVHGFKIGAIALKIATLAYAIEHMPARV